MVTATAKLADRGVARAENKYHRKSRLEFKTVNK